jgi:membrane fusion protein (multidrug efflux system)
VEVQARVAGIVQQRVFTEGTDVKRGDLLYVIDPAEFQQALAKAEGQLADAQADLANAQAKEQRLAPLVQEDAISRQDYDDAVTAVRQAQGRVTSARATVDAARIDLGYTRIVATETGRIGETLVPEGRLVGKDGPTKLATIDRIDRVYVQFTLSDRDALALRRAIEAGRIRLAGAKGETRKGFLEGSIDAGSGVGVRVVLPDGTEYANGGRLDFAGQTVNPDTGTINLRGVLPNPDRELLPGMFVRVELSVGTRPNAIVVPQQAVVKTPTGHVAWVVTSEDKVERRDLVVGPWLGKEWVIDKGLAAGERVVVEGVQRVQPGMTVRPVPYESAPAAPPPAAASPAAPPAAKK